MNVPHYTTRWYSVLASLHSRQPLSLFFSLSRSLYSCLSLCPSLSSNRIMASLHPLASLSPLFLSLSRSPFSSLFLSVSFFQSLSHSLNGSEEWRGWGRGGGETEIPPLLLNTRFVEYFTHPSCGQQHLQINIVKITLVRGIHFEISSSNPCVSNWAKRNVRSR